MKNVKKKVVSIILATSIIFMAVPNFVVNASTDEQDVISNYINKVDNCLWVDGANEKESKEDLIRWQYNSVDSKYYLYLPSSSNLESLKIWHTFNYEVNVDGKLIKNGQATNAFLNEGEHIVQVGNEKYYVVIMKGGDLSSMFITTDNEDIEYINSDKSNTDSGNILIAKANGSIDYDSTFSKIKGRGNTTWDKEKKPYNLTLDKKAGLLGMDSSKKWCLLANYNDASLIRNQVAYDLAKESGIDYSSDSRQVNLYVNGEYEGVYQLCEKVELGKNNLVKITDLEDETKKINDKDLDTYAQGGSFECKNGTNKYFNIPNNPKDITGGYLLEFEMVSRYKDSSSGFVTNLGQPIIMKSPEYASKEQVDYISSFYQEFEEAVLSEDGINTKGKHYSDYVDIPSLAKMYFVQELSKNVDVALTSFYFYKDSDFNGDGKLHAAPAWDFDIAFGNYNDTITDERNALGLLVPTTYIGGADWNVASNVPTIFTQLFKHNDFIKEVCNEWTSNFYDKAKLLVQDKTSGTDRLKSIKEYKDSLESSAKMNFNRWDILGDNLTGVYEGESYDDVVKYLYDFINDRIEYLDKVYRESNGYGEVAERINDDKTVKVYFDNSISKWDDVCLSMYTYNGSLPFTTVKMDKVEGTEDLYYAEVSTVNDDIFFNTSDWKKRSNTTKEPLGFRNCYKMYSSESGAIGRWCNKDIKLKLTKNIETWQGGYKINFEVKNDSIEVVDKWSLKVKKGNLNIINFWNVNISEEGDCYIITPNKWNEKVGVLDKISFGIQGEGELLEKDFKYKLEL